MNNLLSFKSFSKFLSRNKVFTAINIFGLSLSLMFVILIAVYTVQELSIDRNQEKAGRIYAIGSEEVLGSAWKLKPLLLDRYPEIEAIVPTISDYQGQTVTLADKTVTADLLFTDTSFFSVFTFPLVHGDLHRVMETPGYAVISESFARKMFHDADPLGQYIKLNDSVTVTVNGIMKDIKNSIFPSTDILVNIEHIRFFNESLASETFNNAIGANLFILVKENADLHAKIPDIEEYFCEIYWWFKNGIAQHVVLYPFKDIYFSDVKNYNSIHRGDWSFVMILMSVGILILLFAVTNYINLTVAQTGQRAKEMSTRRLLGSSRSELFIRLILESTLLCLFSFLLCLLLAYAAVSTANNLLQTKIDIPAAATLLNTFICILFILGLSVVSGLIPAIIISNSKPIDVVRGGFRRKTKMVFSKVFITFQNVITILMIVASIVMTLQINHMISAPLGYNTANIIEIPTYQLKAKERIFTVGNEIEKLSSVNRVAYAAGAPFSGSNNNTVEYDGRNISFQVIIGDSCYFSMMGFKILQENNAASSDAVYLTEQAIRELMIPIDTPSFKLYEQDIPIAGIVKDFQLGNILRDVAPIKLRLRKHDQYYPWSIFVEIQGDPAQAFEQIKQAYEAIAELDFPGNFIDQQIENSFQSQRRILKIVMIFCVIAVLISLLGLLAMSTYFIQQRLREVAVCKVFGASNGQMLIKLVRTFLNYVLVAFIIATPLSWYIMTQWLSGYSYRISLYPWIFVVSGLLCFIIAFITVFGQSYKAANTNPVESVKAE